MAQNSGQSINYSREVKMRRFVTAVIIAVSLCFTSLPMSFAEIIARPRKRLQLCAVSIEYGDPGDSFDTHVCWPEDVLLDIRLCYIKLICI